jgi:hypothetical protein
MRVSVMPGAYAFTVIPYLPNSCASKARHQFMDMEENGLVNGIGIPAACVRPRIANLDAPYAETMLAPDLMT